MAGDGRGLDLEADPDADGVGTWQEPPEEAAERLEALSQSTGQSASEIAGRVVANYLDHDAEIVRRIEEGLEDFRTGNTVSHDEAMAFIRQRIDEASEER